MSRVRCAIYTRKSSEEGLEQDFNSLDAQFEACAAYIKSQANFVLFQAGDRAIPIRDELRSRGILVRDRSYELPGCVRVTVGTRDQVQRFLDELEQIAFLLIRKGKFAAGEEEHGVEGLQIFGGEKRQILRVDDLKLTWDTSVRYNLGARAGKLDTRIGDSRAAFESDYKFSRRGSIVTDRLDLL